jgi:hypothetical protein
LGLGLALGGVSASGVELIGFDSTWEFRRGLGEASDPRSAWREVGFDGAGFAEAPAPFWYGDVRAGGTELADMQGSYSCIFLRKPFVVGDPATVSSLVLRAYVDDGFVAWINGVEVARENVEPLNPEYDDLSITYLTEPVPTIAYPLPSPGGYLVPGTNVLAVQVFNVSLSGSSDLGFDGALEAVILETIPPEIASVAPAPGVLGALPSVTVTFTEPVTGVNAADLRVNGIPAGGLGGGGDTYIFYLGPLPEGVASVTWSAGHGITDLAAPGNPFDASAPGATWQYTLVDSEPPEVAQRFPAAGASVRSLEQIDVTFSEPVLGVQAADLLINGAPASGVAALPEGPAYRFTFSEPSPGPVSVVWAAGHGITDRAESSNPFAGGSWGYTLDPTLPADDLRITEILAANLGTSGFLDEDGEAQDWIEIHNHGSGPIDLAGWALSDDPALPGLWSLPAATLEPGAYRVIFASGKDRRPIDGEWHANFKLSASGEHLGLYTPDSPRRLADGFDAYPEQRNDISYGTDPAGNLRYFANPTPGAPNGASTIVGVVEPVHVNVQRGLFANPFDLVLSCPTPGALIRFTTNGSEPGASSPVFPASTRINRTTLLRAAAFKDNHLPSKTATHSYLFDVPAAIRSLPVVSIVTDADHLWGPSGIMGFGPGYRNVEQHGLAWERPTSVEWIEPDDHDGFQVDCGIRIQGSDYNRQNASPDSKFSFRLYFRGDYGPGRLEYPLFPLTSVDRFDGIVLRAGFNEQGNPFIRDEIHRRLFHDMGQIASHGNLAVVFVNGGYYQNPSQPWILPVYNPCERVHAEFFQEHLGGSDEWDVVKPPWQLGGGAVDGTFQDMQDLVNAVRFNLDATEPEDYAAIGACMDLTNFVDYLVLNTYAAMGDWPNNNWRAGRDTAAGGIWRWTVWDAEWGMGIYDRTPSIDSFLLSGGGPSDSGLAGTSEIAYLYQGLRASSEFRLLWADRVQKHFAADGALSRQQITNRFEELEAELSGMVPVMDAEILEWARIREPIYFTQMRNQGLLSPVEAPGFAQHGGRISEGFELAMSHAGGTIYYTLDGSDPRVMWTGAVSASASAYAGPVPLTGSVTVKARARQGEGWSALVEASFTHASLGIPLRITEIMYNPPGGSLYEFIELANTSASTLDLGGISFSGIDFRFHAGTILGPGERLVLGSNTDTNAWLARYPGVVPAGWFAANLSNAGERIALYDADGRLITSVDYDDGGGWPAAADGAGSSLELIDPHGDPDAPANWQASTTVGGSPGAANTAPPPPAVVLHELMAANRTAVPHGGTFPDWLELHNPGAAAVDISDWSLTDNGDVRQFVFPAGTIMQAGGYLVVWCDAATNAAPGLHAGFALDNDRETVSLYDAAGNRIDAVSYGLQIADLSIGRDGAGDWTLTLPTPNDDNNIAAMAPASALVLNEWMADSPAGEDDWIELYNTAAALPVSLQGLYLAAGDALSRLSALSYLPPLGYAQIRADEGVGPLHVDFRLPASGGEIRLYDPAGALVDAVTYGPQHDGISEGRLPDGSATILAFPGSTSPAAPNYIHAYAGPILNEVLARNTAVEVDGRYADFVELYNPGTAAFDLGGMSLSVDQPRAGAWVFPPNTILDAGAFLVVPCDSARPPSTDPGAFNLADSMDGDSGGAYLFDAAGRLVDAVNYGPQIRDASIGLDAGQWRLLSSPTPGEPNAAAAALGSNTALIVNEWMADPARGDAWFELYNADPRPVDLGTVSLSDDPSLVGEAKFLPAPLSFIAGGGFVRWIADDSPGAGRHHVDFALDERGEIILVFAHNHTGAFTLVDGVAFGAQTRDVSMGSMPDGSATVIAFPGSASPAASNYRLLTDVVINEILTHADPPFEDAVELYNPAAQPIDLGGWYLSDSRDQFRKYQFPAGTVLPADGFLPVYEYQFQDGSPVAFGLNAAHGGELWLSEADPGGTETGNRTRAAVGAARNGVSFGRVATTEGIDYAAVTEPTFGVDDPADVTAFRAGTGAANAVPLVGPVVINEIHYHPPDDAPDDREYLELLNNSPVTAPLYHPVHVGIPWKLDGGVEYIFPPDTALGPGEALLVVDFDPVAEPATLSAFRAWHGIDAGVAIYGPFNGRLANDRDDVELVRPDTPQPPSAPDAGFVPYILADHVHYADAAPWPTGDVDGGGHSLQRITPRLYGNEPLNWLAAAPSPGNPNTTLAIDTDHDGIPDAAERAMGMNPADPNDGYADADGDGQSNAQEYVAGTNHLDPYSFLQWQRITTRNATTLSFQAAGNRTYSVLSTDSLLNPTWTPFTIIPPTPIHQLQRITLPEPEPGTHFYILEAREP